MENQYGSSSKTRHRITYVCVHSVAQLCLTLWNSMDWDTPGSSVCGIFQARILEWVAISISRGSSGPRDQTWVSRTAGRLYGALLTLQITQQEGGGWSLVGSNNGGGPRTTLERAAQWMDHYVQSLAHHHYVSMQWKEHGARSPDI